MALTEVQQIAEVIKKSRHILVTFPKDFSVDAVASALALYLVLKKQGKLVDVACSEFIMPKNLKFLPESAVIGDTVDSLQKFVITIDAGKDKIEEFSYNLEGDKLKIYITPKSGAFKKENLHTENSQYKYDVIITLDTPDLNSIGKNFLNFTEFFYNTTVINIDHHPENEQFGQINYTDMNAVATAELLYGLIEELDQNLIDAQIATCLLAGLIAKTKSFKTANVTPKTLDIAGALMTADADRETIIKNLYRSRSVATLNLWGRVLARLKNQHDNNLVWSLLTEHDFIEAGAEATDLPDVVDELISFIPGVEIVVLIYQVGGVSNVLVQTLKNYNALYLAGAFNPEGSKTQAHFSLSGKTLQDAEKEVITSITERLGQK